MSFSHTRIVRLALRLLRTWILGLSFHPPLELFEFRSLYVNLITVWDLLLSDASHPPRSFVIVIWRSKSSFLSQCLFHLSPFTRTVIGLSDKLFCFNFSSSISPVNYPQFAAIRLHQWQTVYFHYLFTTSGYMIACRLKFWGFYLANVSGT